MGWFSFFAIFGVLSSVILTVNFFILAKYIGADKTAGIYFFYTLAVLLATLYVAI